MHPGSLQQQNDQYKKNADAASTKIPAFTKKAAFNATALSIILYFMAFFVAVSLLLIFLVCTRAECRYKLCGITVAPMIPTAIYKASSLKAEGTKPLAISPMSGFAKNISIKKRYAYD